jgi:hypothetical protein
LFEERRDKKVVPIDTRWEHGSQIQHAYAHTEYREQGKNRYAELQMVERLHDGRRHLRCSTRWSARRRRRPGATNESVTFTPSVRYIAVSRGVQNGKSSGITTLGESAKKRRARSSRSCPRSSRISQQSRDAVEQRAEIERCESETQTQTAQRREREGCEQRKAALFDNGDFTKSASQQVRVPTQSCGMNRAFSEDK